MYSVNVMTLSLLHYALQCIASTVSINGKPEEKGGLGKVGIRSEQMDSCTH